MKHAYLILAHNEFDLLKKLLMCLDCSNNDIFVHIDKKVNANDLPKIRMKNASINISQRINVSWGDMSQIKCEMYLFNLAIKNSDAVYFHLLSGVDLPIKSQAYIDRFFEKNKGLEFINFFQYTPAAQNDLQRVEQYYFFPFKQKKFNVNLNKYLSALQRKMRIKRKHDLIIYKGANWCSLTRKFVEMLLKNIDLINKEFAYSFCADELYKQTLFMQHKDEFVLYKSDMDDDYHSVARKIDWQRGNPYVWKKENYDELINSDYLFARKFSMKVDPLIVDLIVKNVINNEL